MVKFEKHIVDSMAQWINDAELVSWKADNPRLRPKHHTTGGAPITCPSSAILEVQKPANVSR